MPSLADLLRGSLEEEKPRISHAGQIAILREFHEDYRSPISFKPGDLVTPKRSSCLKGAGEPHLVVDVLPDAPFSFAGTVSTNNFGKKFDVRVACLTAEGHVTLYWMEHSELETFYASVTRPEIQADAA